MLKRVLLIGVIVVALLLVAGGGFAIWAMGSPDFPAPTGAHAVGTTEVAFTDAARKAGLGAAPAAPREVGVRIWYPAAKNAAGARLPVIDGRLSKAFSDMYGMPMGDADGPPSASIIDAPPAQTDGRLPVVLFSHGGFAHRDQNLSTMEELASHGFIVVAIGHTHEAILSLLPEGRSVPMDARLAKGMAAFAGGNAAAETQYLAALEQLTSASDRQAGVAAAREVGQGLAKMLEPAGRPLTTLTDLRRGDVAFVRAQLAELDADPDHPLHGRYDLDHVGVFGHSLGGYTAVAACLDPAVPVHACISLDSTYHLSAEEPAPPRLARPVLFVAASATGLPTGSGEYNLAGSNRYLGYDAAVPPQHLVVEGTSHMNFSDMNFMPRLMRLVGVLGPIDGPRAGTIVDDVVVSFFRRHLRSEQVAWLDAPGERYPELRPAAR